MSDNEKARELVERGLRCDRSPACACEMREACVGTAVTAIASALRDARVEGRREMRDEAADIVEQWRAFDQTKADKNHDRSDQRRADRLELVRDAIRALPIATQPAGKESET